MTIIYIDVVIDLVKTFGSGALMVKTDIEDAFRVIPIHPLDYQSAFRLSVAK